MPVSVEDTIAAVASPPGAAERGIVRISGPGIRRVLSPLFESGSDWQTARLPQRHAGQMNLPALSIPLDVNLLFWPGSRSYTGQPMAEVHMIGSPPLLDAVLEGVLGSGARHAERGEFTMRAFLAGRIDLVQAEGVLGVIDAADHTELAGALTQLGGGITSSLASVRNEVLALLGDLEAGLDFVEEDIEFISQKQICARLLDAETQLERLLAESHSRLPSGYRPRVVLAGLPNAGKSTLFNLLVRDEKAIVSPIAGTTRDYLSAQVSFGGRDAELIDTAGHEQTADLIMQQAQELRSQQLQAGDLIVWCSAADEPCEPNLPDSRLEVLAVTTRGDLAENVSGVDLVVSSQDRESIHELESAIATHLQQMAGGRSELVASTAARCRDSLQSSMTAIQSARASAESGLGDEITAMELRSALHGIAAILGEVYTDDILDHIFSNFCIGK